MSTNFLSRYFDPALTPPKVSSREELEQREVDRLTRALAVVIMAGSIPRRLGGDASDDELAKDKKRARRAGHALSQALKGWSKKYDLPLDDKIRMEGAQIKWDDWLTVHVTKIQDELRCLATWAVLNNEERWGRSAVVNLENEINWLTYALRD